jgi:hypothetical protein
LIEPVAEPEAGKNGFDFCVFIFVLFRFVWLIRCLVHWQHHATYQAGGDCPQVFCNNSKINYHFFLAILESPTATRHSRDSTTGK